MGTMSARVTGPVPHPRPPRAVETPIQSAKEAQSGRVSTYAHQKAATALRPRKRPDSAGTVIRAANRLLSLGHDEYWTPQQREHVTRARDAGTNVAFLGANACFRRVRLEPGPRLRRGARGEDPAGPAEQRRCCVRGLGVLAE